jgi:hypothetical protein
MECSEQAQRNLDFEAADRGINFPFSHPQKINLFCVI